VLKQAELSRLAWCQLLITAILWTRINTRTLSTLSPSTLLQISFLKLFIYNCCVPFLDTPHLYHLIANDIFSVYKYSGFARKYFTATPHPRFRTAELWQVTSYLGRAITQEVSRWLPTAAQVRSCGICGGQWHWGRFSPSTSVSLTNSHSIDCPTLIIYPPKLVQ
jgi:hypothetical protein